MRARGYKLNGSKNKIHFNGPTPCIRDGNKNVIFVVLIKDMKQLTIYQKPNVNGLRCLLKIYKNKMLKTIWICKENVNTRWIYTHMRLPLKMFYIENKVIQNIRELYEHSYNILISLYIALVMLTIIFMNLICSMFIVKSMSNLWVPATQPYSNISWCICINSWLRELHK